MSSNTENPQVPQEQFDEAVAQVVANRRENGEDMSVEDAQKRIQEEIEQDIPNGLLAEVLEAIPGASAANMTPDKLRDLVNNLNLSSIKASAQGGGIDAITGAQNTMDEPALQAARKMLSGAVDAGSNGVPPASGAGVNAPQSQTPGGRTPN